MTSLSTRNRECAILLVEHEQLISDALQRLIDEFPGFQVTHSVSSVSEATEALKALPIDLIVSELDLPERSGIDLVLELGRRSIDAGVILLYRELSAESGQDALMAGALGLVSRNAKAVELEMALQYATIGRRYLPREIDILNAIDDNYYATGSTTAKSDPIKELTPREREIFHLLAIGLSNIKIAKRLYISPRTVETHKARITKKLSLSSNGEIIRFALRHGLTSL